MPWLASVLAGVLAQSDEETAGLIAALIAAVFGGIGFLIGLAITIVMLAGMWKLYVKAGEPGWAAIIPFYNIWVLLKIVGRPQLLWFILWLIPFVNIVVTIVVMFDLAKSFARGAGFAIGLILLAPIFMVILGFGDSQYGGPAALAGPAQPA